jgi:hypothetical protein
MWCRGPCVNVELRASLLAAMLVEACAGEGTIAVGRSHPADPARLNINSELKRTRGFRLFNKNIALRWRQRVMTQCDFCPVL